VSEKIAKDLVVGIDYRLTIEDGTEVDSTAERGPMEYLHGHRNIVPGLEKELTGREVGDSLEVTIGPEEGYGEHDPERIVQVSRQQPALAGSRRRRCCQPKDCRRGQFCIGVTAGAFCVGLKAIENSVDVVFSIFHRFFHVHIEG